MNSTASLPAVSSRSLPGKRQAPHGARGLVNTHPSPCAPPEACTDFVAVATCVSLPPASCSHLPDSDPACGEFLPDSSLERLKGNSSPQQDIDVHWSLSSMLQKVRSSLSSTETTASQSECHPPESGVVPFMLPSALRVAESPMWEREVVPPSLERQAWAERDERLRRMREARTRARDESPRSDDDNSDAWGPPPRRKLSPSALRQLENSLRHALRTNALK